MRIALVIGTLNYGGGETQLVRLGIELTRRGHDVKVFVLDGAGPLARDLDEAGVPFASFGFEGYNIRRPAHTVAAVVRTARMLRAFRPDVVHAWLVQALMLTMPLARVLRVRVRVSERLNVGERLEPSPRLRPLFRLSQRCSNLVVPNARAVAAEVLDVEHLDASVIHVIENGVEIPSEVVADVAAEPPIGYVVANLRPQKNHVNLLRALAIMEDPPVVHLVGSGPEEGRIRAEISALGLGDVVVMEGPVHGAAECFSRGQFGVLPSDYEGMPNAMQECMARGVPMVATAVAGVPEMITDGVEGLLVPPGDPKALAAALGRMCGDPDLRVQMGQAARRRMEQFSWDRTVDRHLSAYALVLERTSGRSGSR